MSGEGEPGRGEAQGGAARLLERVLLAQRPVGGGGLRVSA